MRLTWMFLASGLWFLPVSHAMDSNSGAERALAGVVGQPAFLAEARVFVVGEDPAAPGVAEPALDVEVLSAPKERVPEPHLRSGSALVLDMETGTALYEKNSDELLPIASLTKLMTAMLVLDAKLPLDEKIKITRDDVDRLRWSSSRLPVGSTHTRLDLLKMALIASENRAAAALGRTYPGGRTALLAAANRKAHKVGMTHSYFADPTGLDSNNRSTANDLAKMVKTAYGYGLIRDISTTPYYQVKLRKRRAPLRFPNTNAIVKNKNWDVGLSKTGFINEAGHCLVMQARIASRSLIIVLLDAQGKYTRIGDANRIKQWLEKATDLHAAVADDKLDELS